MTCFHLTEYNDGKEVRVNSLLYESIDGYEFKSPFLECVLYSFFESANKEEIEEKISMKKLSSL